MDQPEIDLHSAVERAVRTQLAWLDFSVACWESMFNQSVELTRLLTHNLESLQSGEPQLADSMRRLTALGLGNGNEIARLTAVCGSLLFQTLVEPASRANRGRPRDA